MAESLEEVKSGLLGDKNGIDEVSMLMASVDDDPSLWTCHTTKDDYELLPQKSSLKLSIFIDKSEFDGNLDLLVASQFTVVPALEHIITMLAKVLEYPLDKCHLVVQDNSTIAFNLGGDIFFNVYAMISVLGRGPRHALNFWLVPFCHEIARNTDVDSSSPGFANAFGDVMRSHFSAFKLLSQDIVRNGADTEWERFYIFHHGKLNA